MDLQAFFDSLSSEELASFAKAVGTKPVYIRQMATKFRKPSPAMAKRLHQASKGKITLEKLRPDIWST